jgi:hypothetical protein
MYGGNNHRGERHKVRYTRELKSGWQSHASPFSWVGTILATVAVDAHWKAAS